MPSPAAVPPLPVRDVLTGVETLQATMSGPAAGELVFAVDAARRAGTVARWLIRAKDDRGAALDPLP